MLSDAEDAPAASAQFSVHCPVTFPIALNLGLPKLPVPFRGAIALWTAVPEAPVDKDRQPLLPEREVGLSWKLQMPPPSCNAFLTEELNQHPLRPLVAFPPDP